MSKGEDDELARAWHELMNRYHRVSCVLDRALQAEHGITGSEFAVLEQLAEARDCSLRLHELGEHTHVTQSALSRLVARLESDGFVERAMCVEDRRSVFARLTPAGRELYRKARPTHRAVLRESGGDCLAAVGAAFASAGPLPVR
jgi:DNA-binding MarR family transcriptional regulator